MDALLLLSRSLLIPLLFFAILLVGRACHADSKGQPHLKTIEVKWVEGDATLEVQKAVDEAIETGADRLVFEKGRYEFTPGTNPKWSGYGIIFHSPKNMTIDGQGSEFIFDSKVGGFYIHEGENINLINLVIDWKRPLFSVGEVLESREKGFDVRIWDEFPVEGGEPVAAYMDYEKETRLPRIGGIDLYHGVERTELIAPQTLRVFQRVDVRPSPGDLVVLRHQVYANNAITLDHCKGARVADLAIYTCPGMGIVAKNSHDVSISRLQVRPKPGTNRIISTTADATHFSGCTGMVRITDSYFEGMGDDAGNIKTGLYLTIKEILDNRTVVGQHNLNIPDPPSPGDLMEFIDTEDLLTYATRRVESVTTPDNHSLHRVTFSEDLPSKLKVGDVIGNASRAARVYIARNTVKNNRARGFLLQIRGAVVEDNHFENITGAALNICTEVVHFFESIGTRDITVRNNRMINCGYGAALSQGAISIYALLSEFREGPKPGVHSNIRLENNIIDGSDNSGIFASATDGLHIQGNTITNVSRRATMDSGKAAIHIRSTRNAIIRGNQALPEDQGKDSREMLQFGPGVDMDTIRVEDNKGF